CRPAQRTRELAGLSVLERRARRHVAGPGLGVVRMSAPRVTAIHPLAAIEGGRVTIQGAQFPLDQPRLPEVRIADLPARIVHASSTAIAAIVPPGITESGRATIRIAGMAGETAFVDIAAPFATGLHQGDNPVVGRDGRANAFASLPASVAAFHLAIGPDGALFATAPTLSSYDAVYRIDPDGTVTVRASGFGRPQGIAFDATGTLHVVEALAGVSGLYRLPPTGGPAELALSG